MKNSLIVESVANFCWQRDVSTASFYNWKRLLREASSTHTVAATIRDGDEHATAKFVAIDVPAVSSVPSTHCEVLLIDGRRVRVPMGFDQDSLISTRPSVASGIDKLKMRAAESKDKAGRKRRQRAERKRALERANRKRR